MYLTWLDLAVIVVYLAGLAILGMWLSRRQSSTESYFLGNRDMPWLAVGVSVMATLISTLSFLALPGEMIGHGAGFFYSVFGLLAVIPLVNRVIIPALMRLPVTSVYEYFEKRYDISIRVLGAGIFVLTRLLWVGMIMYTASFAVHEMTGWNTSAIILVIGIVTAFYTTAGGMSAVVWSDFAQGILLLGGAMAVPFYVAYQTGSGPEAWWEAFSEAGRDRAPVFSWDVTTRVSLLGVMLYSFTWNACTQGADQVAAQRYLSTSSVADARRSVWVYSLSTAILMGLLMAVGLSLFFFHFHESNLPIERFSREIAAAADGVFPRFIAKELPKGLSGLLLAAILAAAMSSLSSGINSVCTVLTTDVVDRFSAAPRKREGLAGVRITAAAVGAIGILAALAVDAVRRTSEWNLVEMMVRLNELFVAPLGALFLMGVLSRRVGSAAALWGFLAGALTSALISFSQPLFGMKEAVSFMWMLPASLAASVVVALAASFFTAPPTPEQLASLSSSSGAKKENSP